MEVEKAVDSVETDKRESPVVDQNEDIIGDLINEAKAKAEAETHVNGTKDTANGADPGQKVSEVNGSSEDSTAGPEQPSERVREGQKWNDRYRKNENQNDRNRPMNNRKYDRSQYKDNIKSDLTSQQESSDPVAIRKQVEFYFSDSNLLQDHFLFTKIEGHKNLPVPISVIHSFKRMRHFQPLSAIVDALKESTILDLVDEDTCIQRKEALPEGLVGKPMYQIKQVYEDKSMARSIYAKGFGDEGPSTQFDIEAFFAKYGSTNSVRLRRMHPEQTFKGSVFVEFDSEATQKSFLALNPTPKWQDKELDIKSKKQYCDLKVDDIKAGKIRPNSQDGQKGHQSKSHGQNRRGSPDRRSGGKDDSDWRTRRDQDQKSGFRGKHGGKYRGFGGSGRGSRGGRGDRGDRGNRTQDDEGVNRDERGVPKITTTSEPGDQVKSGTDTPAETTKKDENPVKVNDNVSSPVKNGDKSADASMAPPPMVPATAKEPTSTNEGSKKRPREEDDVSEGQGSAKKVDLKSEQSGYQIH